MRRLKACGLWLGVVAASVIVFFSLGEVTAEENDSLVAKLQSVDPMEHSSVVAASGKASGDKTVAALITIVEGRRDDWKLQISAIRLLGEIGNPMATELLIRVVTDHFFTNECPALKWNGIIALGNFRDDPRVVDALLYRLGEDTLYLREAVIQSLGRIGNREALPYLVAALNEKSFAVRISAVRALGEMGDREAVPLLRKIAVSDADPLLRDEALKAVEGLSKR